jgi:hypothetical protein
VRPGTTLVLDRSRRADNSTLHDFMMLDPLREASPATAAFAQGVDVLRRALRPSPTYAGHVREG